MAIETTPPGSVLLRSLPEAVLLVGADGRITDASERVSRVLDRRASALPGVPFTDLFVPTSATDVARALEELGAEQDQGEVLELDATVTHPEGEDIDVVVRLGAGADGLVAVLRRRTRSAHDLLTGMLDAVSATSVGTDVVEGALREIGRSFEWDRAAMWVVDDRTGLLHVVAAWERHPDPTSRYRDLTLDAGAAPAEGPAGRAWADEAVLVTDRFDDDERFGTDGVTTPATGVFCPIRAAQRPVGVLELLSQHEVDPHDWIATALTAVEPALGHLLERFRDRLAVDVAEGRLAIALDAGRLGVATLDPRAGWVEWSARMAELHGQSAVRGQGPLTALLASVHPDDLEELRTTLTRAREPGDAPESVDYRIVGDDGSSRWVSTRVSASRVHGGRPLVAAISADITEQKEVEHQTQRRAMAVEGLQWVSQALIAGRELDDTAVAVCHATTGVLGASLGIVLYLAPGDTTTELAWAVSGLSLDVEVPARPPRSVELPADIEAARHTRSIDLRTDPEVRELVRSLGLPVDMADLRSALIVPIRGDRHPRSGTMLVLHRDAGYFTDDDLRLAHAIGTSTGVAIENAQYHEQQRQAANAFQRELLPSTDPEVPDADVCVRYHPGRDGLAVGGDWYDVIPLDNHRVGLAVGDVCGHGLTAAAHMGQFRYSFRALVQSSIAPSEALSVLNRLAIEELGTMLTVVYVELDLRTGECRTWRCGHLPPAVASGDGTRVRWLGAEDHRGPMLGFLDEVRLTPSADHLAPGEVLLLYTDGLVERRDETIDDGLVRLRAALTGRSADLHALCDELYHALVEVGSAEDDTAMLAIRRR